MERVRRIAMPRTGVFSGRQSWLIRAVAPYPPTFWQFEAQLQHAITFRLRRPVQRLWRKVKNGGHARRLGRSRQRGAVAQQRQNLTSDSAEQRRFAEPQGPASPRRGPAAGLVGFRQEPLMIKREGCEFCTELAGEPSRFPSIYGIQNRVVARFGEIVALPSIGQLFPGTLLLLPRFHIETFASQADALGPDLQSAISALSARLREFANVVCFEHGAAEGTGAACGIYHAHFHIVPVPRPVTLRQFIPDYLSASGLHDGLSSLSDSTNYFMMLDSDGHVGYLDERYETRILTSQFGRRTLARIFEIDSDWNWRTYSNRREAWVLDTLRMFEVDSVLSTN